MSTEPEPASLQNLEEDRAPTPGRQRRRRFARRYWPLLTLVLGVGLVLAMDARVRLSPYPSNELVLFGATEVTWEWLTLALGLVLVAIAIPVLVHRLTVICRVSPANRELITGLAAAAIGGLCLLSFFPIFFMIGLSYDETRTVAVVDGRELVVSQHAPLNFENYLQAGFRSGLFVDFTATGDTNAHAPTTSISTWSFRVRVHPHTVTIDYDGTSTGQLTVPRP